MRRCQPAPAKRSLGAEGPRGTPRDSAHEAGAREETAVPFNVRSPRLEEDSRALRSPPRSSGAQTGSRLWKGSPEVRVT